MTAVTDFVANLQAFKYNVDSGPIKGNVDLFVAALNALSAGGGGSPGGLNTQVQYNNAGAFGGITNVTSDGTNIALGTPISGVATNITGLPISSGVSGLGAGVATLLGGASSGTGGPAGTTSPALTTPNIGTPSAGTLTNCTGLPLTTGVTGNLAVTHLNSGTGASATTFWRGDGTWVTPTAGAPGGLTTQVQYNNAGAFGGISGVTTDGTNIALGTPLSGVLTNATGLPISTGVSGLGAGVATLLGGASSGTGGPAGTTSPTFVTPTLGVATATSVTIGATGTSLDATGNVLGNADVRAGTTNFIYWNNRSALKSPSDGIITLSNNGATDFTRLQFGGTSSSFPSIKRNSAALQFRLADDSADTPVIASLFQVGTTTGSDTVLLQQGNSGGGGPLIQTGNGGISVVIIPGSAGKIRIAGGANPNAGRFDLEDAGSSFRLSMAAIATANLRLGLPANPTPVAQTFTIGEASRSGTDSNVGGANGTIQSGLGTGNGTFSSLIFQVPITAGGTATSVQTYGNMLKLGPSIVLGNAALATTATDGFIYIPTCAGTPTGVPTAQTGRAPLIFDTTNNQFWIYDGAWLQPKTPGGVSLVSWQ